MGLEGTRRLKPVVEIRFRTFFLCKVPASLERRSRAPLHFASLHKLLRMADFDKFLRQHFADMGKIYKD